VTPVAADPLEGWVVSVDLWGTLITYGDREAEAAWRIREFETVLTEFGHDLPDGKVREAILAVRADTQRRQRTTGEQPPVRGQVEQMLTVMGLPLDTRLIDTLLVPHTHAVLRACPDIIPGAHSALWALRQAGARLVLTSNTLATPASVSRLILDDHDLTTVFDETVFSSDVGLAKPRWEMFAAVATAAGTDLSRVVHVGNSVTTDIHGALNAGCRAVLFNPGGKPCPAGVRAITSLDQMPIAVLATCS
jgi:putative hydrolase of the HAD superfamily